METRQVTEYKIYALNLNRMTGNTENWETVAIAYDKQRLIDWYNSKLAPASYVKEGHASFECQGDSHKWHKTFQEGSELEWFNPCEPDFSINYWGTGITEQWVRQEAIDNAPMTKLFY